MNNTVTILISSAGRRVELIGCLRKAATALGFTARIVAIDTQPQLSPACQMADLSIAVPRCTDATFVPKLLEICRGENVSLVVPTIDTELAPLAEARARFEESGVRVAVSSPRVISLARDKLASANFFRKLGLNTLRTASMQEVLAEPLSWKFPLIIKPIAGSSSDGFRVLPSVEALRSTGIDPAGYIVQDYQAGNEYTVNLFFDQTRMACAIPHHRLETRGGEVTKAVTARRPDLAAAAEKIGEALGGEAFGPLCFQAIVSDAGELAVIELNARFGGGYPLADFAGATFAKWLLEIVLGIPCSSSDSWTAGLTMLRYDSSLFLTGERETQPLKRIS